MPTVQTIFRLFDIILYISLTINKNEPKQNKQQVIQDRWNRQLEWTLAMTVLTQPQIAEPNHFRADKQARCSVRVLSSVLFRSFVYHVVYQLL